MVTEICRIVPKWSPTPVPLPPRPGGGVTVVGDHFGTCPPISISIDGTSPKLLWWIALVKVYKHTKFQVKTR